MSVVFVINPGASSKKYALLEDGRVVIDATYEVTASGWQRTLHQNGDSDIQTESEHSYQHSLLSFAKVIKSWLKEEDKALSSIGIRVVASGSYFQSHRLVDDQLISLLKAQEHIAPLHAPAVLAEIQQAKLEFPGISLVAASDTAFFSGMPPEDREYSLDRTLVKEHDIHRFGYHGLSVSSVTDRVHSIIGSDPERLVVCHLGGGSSVSGLVNGRAVSTSAGIMTLGSLPMTSRAGDADAGLLLYLEQVVNKDPAFMSDLLHHRGGLQGLAETEDLRHVFEHQAQGDADAAFALSLYTYRLQQEIAAATVATGGIDALVFTGTIGFRSPALRMKATERLTHFGIGIDEEKNDHCLGREGVIHLSRSLVKVLVMRTDETREIGRIADSVNAETK